jgi:hypothetical protein
VELQRSFCFLPFYDIPTTLQSARIVSRYRPYLLPSLRRSGNEFSTRLSLLLAISSRAALENPEEVCLVRRRAGYTDLQDELVS